MDKIYINKILDCLPHRYPFLLVDRIENYVTEGDHIEITGIKNVTFNEPFFQGHFPGEPVMPGVLILEAMGQVGGVLLKLVNQTKMEKDARQIVYLTSIDRAKFRKPVIPGDQLRTTARMLRKRGNMGKFEFTATVDGEIAAEAVMGFVISSKLTKD